MMLSIKWHGRGQGCEPLLFSVIPKSKPSSLRKKAEVIKVNISTSPESNRKKANLSAARKERIKVPEYEDGCGGKTFHISEFLSHPSGIQALLNTSALQDCQALDTYTYSPRDLALSVQSSWREPNNDIIENLVNGDYNGTTWCFLPKLQLLNFAAAPVLDLRVTPTNTECTVEMLSCKFEGSEIMEHQNEHFSALMMNHMKWETNESGSFLEADVRLNLTLEIYTRPFTMLPVSAVERPGNVMVQALVDRLVPLLLRRILQDYDRWVQQQMDRFREHRT